MSAGSSSQRPLAYLLLALCLVPVGYGAYLIYARYYGTPDQLLGWKPDPEIERIEEEMTALRDRGRGQAETAAKLKELAEKTREAGTPEQKEKIEATLKKMEAGEEQRKKTMDNTEKAVARLTEARESKLRDSQSRTFRIGLLCVVIGLVGCFRCLGWLGRLRAAG
jgi:hypothetical protein